MFLLLKPATAIALTAFIGMTLPVYAQKHAPAITRRPPLVQPRQKDDRPLDRLQRMTPDQRAKALDKIPLKRRKAIEQRLEKLDRLTPEQRARFDRFRELPPERQQAIRSAIDGVMALPPERQKAVRQEINHLQTVPEAERESRLASPEFGKRFTKEEQDLIRELRDVMPRQEFD